MEMYIEVFDSISTHSLMKYNTTWSEALISRNSGLILNVLSIPLCIMGITDMPGVLG